MLPYSSQVVLPSAEFESATLANIESIFGGRTSASYKFYEQIFNLYNNTPGAKAATPGTFTPGDLGCNGWTDPNNPNGLGTNDACAVHFFKNDNGPANDSIVSGRVDWNMTASDRVFLLLEYGYGRRAAYIDEISPVFNAYANQSTWQSQLSETHTLGPTAANQFLLAGTYIYGGHGVANPAQAQAVFPTVLNWWNEGNTFGSVGGSDWAYGLPTTSRGTSYQISDDLVKTRGKHKLGFGVMFLRTDSAGLNYNYDGTGQLLPQSVDAFFWGGIDPNPSKQNTDYTTLGQTYPPISRNQVAFYSLGLYSQEEWHARSNLTLTLALRADHQSNPVCDSRCFTRFAGPFHSISHDPNQPYNQAILVNQKQAFLNTDSVVWSPRFSFAWQPLGISHNTVLRGGVGIFYDPVPGSLGGGLAFNSPSVNFFNIKGYNLTPGETTSLSQYSSAFNTAFLKGFATGQTLAQIEATNPQFVPPSFQSPANMIHSPQYQRWSLQAQQSFGASTHEGIRVAGSKAVA